MEKKFTLFSLCWASVMRPNCIFGCSGSMCVTAEHVAAGKRVRDVRVSCTEICWDGILALDPGRSCSWEGSNEAKLGRKSNSVPLVPFWLILSLLPHVLAAT